MATPAPSKCLKTLALQIGLLLLRLGQPRIGTVAIDRALIDDGLRIDRGVGLRGIAALDERLHRPPQRIVFRAERIFAAVPAADRLAGDVVEHPALAGLHARLVDARAEHVIVIAHDRAAERVDDFALVAFDVEHGAGRILLVVAVLILAVVGDGQKGSAQRVEMGNGRRVGVLAAFAAASCSSGPKAPFIALLYQVGR